MTQGSAPRPPQQLIPCIWPACRSRSTSTRTRLCPYHLGQIRTAKIEALELRLREYGQLLNEGTVERVQHRSDIARLEAEVKRLTPVKAAPKPAAEGTIYYLRSDGLIKVGFTTRWPLRMRGYSPGSILLAIHPGTRDDETRLKRKFAVHRTHGSEWLAQVPPVMEHIDRVIAEFGLPPTVDFAAKRAATRRPTQKAYVGGNNRGRWQRGEISTGKTA